MRFLIALLLLLLTVVNSKAQVRVNNLQELLQYADNQAPAALQAKLQPLMAKQDVHVQASGLYPKINVFGTGDYYPVIPTQVIPAQILGGAPGTYYKAQFGLPYVFTAGAEVSMPLVNLEKWAQLAKARAAYDQSQWSSKTALESFHIQLVQAYYQALVTKEVLALNDENARTVTELSRIMEARNQSGVVNPSDYNRTKNLDLDVQSSGFNYNKQLSQSVNNLNALLDIKHDSLHLSESINTFNWPVLQNANDASGRPAWQEADYRLRVASLALSESRRGGLPRLSLAGRYAYNMQSKFEAGSSDVKFDAANIGARVDIPLFQGNYYRAMQHKSNLALNSAKLEQEKTRATLLQQQQDWYTQYTAAYSKQAVLDKKVKNASDNLRIAQLNIKEGVMEFDEFNNIFMEYNRARIEYLQNLADGILYYLLSTQNF